MQNADLRLSFTKLPLTSSLLKTRSLRNSCVKKEKVESTLHYFLFQSQRSFLSSVTVIKLLYKLGRKKCRTTNSISNLF